MKGYKGFAFFDVDSTLISINSMISFLNYYYMNGVSVPFQNRAEAFSRTLARFNRDIALGKDRYHMYREYYLLYKGTPAAEISALAYRWWDTQKRSEDTFIGETYRILEKHKLDGLGIALVSGSLLAVVKPLAETVGAEFVAATEIASEDGVFTGHVMGETMLGEGKAKAAVKCMADFGVYPSDCYAYGDHVTDLEMLETVENPCVIGGDPDFENIARERGWPVILPACKTTDSDSET